MSNEPAAIGIAVAAILNLVVLLVLRHELSAGEQAAIITAVTAVAGAFVRSKVTPVNAAPRRRRRRHATGPAILLLALVVAAVTAGGALDASAHPKYHCERAVCSPPKIVPHHAPTAIAANPFQGPTANALSGMTTPSLAYYSAMGDPVQCAPGACDKDYDDGWRWLEGRGWCIYSSKYNGVRYDVTNETTIWWVYFTCGGYQINGPIILRWTNANGYSDWVNTNADRWVWP